MNFHVNPQRGVPSKCRAALGNCVHSSPDEHYATSEEAAEAWSASEKASLKGKTIVLSDIDGTLVRSSLVLESAFEMHNSKRVDLGDWPHLWREDMKNEHLVRELADAYRAKLVGSTVGFIKVRATLDRLMAEESNFYSTLKTLIAHKEAGDEVVLISGSPDFIVGPFARRFGFRYHASKYHRDQKGSFTGNVQLMAGAEAKAKVIKDLRVERFEKVVGLGDTASDIPLLQAAHNSILVAPTKETLKIMKSKNVRIDSIITD